MMNLAVAISGRTAAWLEEKARAAGTDESTIAAKLRDEIAEQKLGDNGAKQDRLWRFREWVNRVPSRPGPPVDANRAGVYCLG